MNSTPDLRNLKEQRLLLLLEKQRRQAAKAQAKSLPDESAPKLSDWIAACVTIEEPQGMSVSIIPFALWPAQVEALAMIESNPQVIVLKARQLGMSWLVIAFAVWMCIYHRGQTVMVFSKDQQSANEMIRRAKGIFNRLKSKPTQLVIDNVATIGWENESRIKSFAATEDAGSSFTGSLTILDEFAKMQYAESLYTSVSPTIADGGRIIIISTAKGEANPFHKLWDAASKRLNSFKAIFLPWHARPTRTREWYARTESDAISPKHHKQEYPAEASEAFVSIGDERFLPDITLWDACQQTIPPLDKNTPMVIALDAGIHSDSFGMVGVTRHPIHKTFVAVRFVQEWRPVSGAISFQGTEDAPGPEMVLKRLCNNYNVVCVAYDPYQLHDMATRLRAEGVAWFKEFSQGPDRLEADKGLFDLIIERRIAHDGNADLRRHVDNANRKPDAETRKLRIVKRETSLKVDLAVCASMASYTALRLDI